MALGINSSCIIYAFKSDYNCKLETTYRVNIQSFKCFGTALSNIYIKATYQTDVQYYVLLNEQESIQVPVY